MRIFFLFLFSVFISIDSFCQNPLESEKENDIWPHSLGFMVGYSWVPQTINDIGEVYINVNPTLGVDYGYFFSEKFGVGFVNDFEFSKYIVQDKQGDYLVRENKYIGALIAIYEPTPFLGLFMGPGYELERHQSFPLFKTGIEVGKRFEDGWGVAINASVDFSDYYETISAGMVVFKRFPR